MDFQSEVFFYRLDWEEPRYGIEVTPRESTLGQLVTHKHSFSGMETEAINKLGDISEMIEEMYRVGLRWFHILPSVYVT